MKQVELEMLSDTINCPVVVVPGRRFPGVVIQGDSLKILLDMVEEIRQLTASSHNDEVDAVAERLKGKLSDYLGEYEAVMRKHGRELPY
jgi:hypothetical protein